MIFAPGFGITYAPRIAKTLYASFSLEQQQFFYDRFGELDFGSFDARAGLTVHACRKLHNLLLRAEYDYNRLTDDGFDEIFADHSIVLSAELPFRIGRAQQVSLGTSAKIVLDSDPEEPGRHDFEGYVGYSVGADARAHADGRRTLDVARLRDRRSNRYQRSAGLRRDVSLHEVAERFSHEHARLEPIRSGCV